MESWKVHCAWYLSQTHQIGFFRCANRIRFCNSTLSATNLTCTRALGFGINRAGRFSPGCLGSSCSRTALRSKKVSWRLKSTKLEMIQTAFPQKKRLIWPGSKAWGYNDTNQSSIGQWLPSLSAFCFCPLIWTTASSFGAAFAFCLRHRLLGEN